MEPHSDQLVQPQSNVLVLDRARRPRPISRPSSEIPIAISPASHERPSSRSPQATSSQTTPDTASFRPQRRSSKRASFGAAQLSSPMASSSSIVYTKTGRRSRAKKGRPVHDCGECGKVYTRAEHLRRHQQNHAHNTLLCNVCGRSFYRRDLLDRHQRTHQQTSPPLAVDGKSPKETLGDHLKRSTPAPSSSPSQFLPATTSATPLFLPQSTNLQVWPGSTIPSGYTPDFIDFPAPFNQFPEAIIPVSGSFTDPTNFLPPPFHQQLDSPSPSNPEFHMEPDQISLGTSVSSSPAPTIAVPPTFVPFPQTHGPEGSLQDEDLTFGILSKSQHTYLEAYWTYFHPMFPILHKRSRHVQGRDNNVLNAAMMAVGAQYTDLNLAGSDVKILHERCAANLRKRKDYICSTNDLELLQAVVLVEFLSHFKAKRAPGGMNEVFRSVYDQLWNMMPSKLDLDHQASEFLIINEMAVRQQWMAWIETQLRLRLLAAAYILETRHGLLLHRGNLRDASDGLEIFLPASNDLWDAQSPHEWYQKVRLSGSLSSRVCEALDAIELNSGAPLDQFQSALVLACYSSSISQQRANDMGLEPTHSMFHLEQQETLAHFLDCQPPTRMQHLVGQMIFHTPLKALIATSGESWFFSKRLAGDAQLAALKFSKLKDDLRDWTNRMRQPDPLGVASLSGLSFPNSVPALHLALQIIEQGTKAPYHTLAFGPELALYFAALVLWAVTFAAITASHKHFDQEDESAELSADSALNILTAWLPAAMRDVGLIGDDESSLTIHAHYPHHHVHASSPAAATVAMDSLSVAGLPISAAVVPVPVGMGMGVGTSRTHSPGGVYPAGAIDAALAAGAPSPTMLPPHAMLDSWRQGSGAVLRWTACVLGGVSHRNSGAGELIEGAVGVLEKLGRSGWAGEWF